MSEQQTAQKLPPGPGGLPFFGNLIEFQQDQLGFMDRMFRTYGSIVTIHIGKYPMFLLFRPEYVRYPLTENPRNFTSLQSSGGDLLEVLGRSLLTIEGEEHRQQRRLVQPAFHKKRIESYANIMVQYTQEMLEGWHEGEEVDIARTMQTLTLRIVAHALFNLELLSQVDRLGELFAQMIEHRRGPVARMLNLYIDLPFTEYGKRMEAKRELDAFIYRLIAERRAAGRDEGDVMSMLLTSQETGSMSDAQVRDHVMTFLAAGHETTSNALTWTFYLLSQYPEARAKLLAELQTVLGGRAPTLDDLPRLTYTEWVINEAMRVYPPVWTIGRRAINAFDLGGYHFPAGSSFLLSQWILHRHPEFWSEPEVFRPERWDPVNGEKVPQGAYFPFGAGPRICIGMPFAQMEARLLLATIMQRYTPRLVPGFRVEFLPRVTLRAKNGLRMILDRTPTAIKSPAGV
ncbi:MAG: cytochrome P450 [Ktedonobacteraceae bacterium]|nr:cytochrome P450 [Ktedonobacteraceae bacterium]